ncbi:MAG: FtsX-like permease family protein [Planctomycetes bacterium]|nr:FtsX-like permease family protein [Planctomycetota bacterium]MBI3845544.1 FtsX-like permease family protein [Planctomycetota bacterium]
MKFLRFIWRNATRNKRRAILTVISISVAIVTICILQTIVVAFSSGARASDASRLVVRNKVSLMLPLPLAYQQRIESMAGVKAVTWWDWFGGNYQDKKNFFAKIAVEAESYFRMYPEFEIPKDQMSAFLADRRGCVIGQKLSEKFGFKLGDTVPIIGDIYPAPSGDTWEFVVKAIYTTTKIGVDENRMFLHWKYLDERMTELSRGGLIGVYTIQIDDPSKAAAVAKAVDAEFENSPEQTLTETEESFQMDFVKMWGNIAFLVRVIGAAVVFALLLVAANTMAMAARERTAEIAILKTLGFRGALLGSLVLAESLMLTIVGWAIGAGLAWVVCLGVSGMISRFLPTFALTLAPIALSLVIAVVIGAVSGVFPALHAARTRIVDAMRKVA